MRLDLRTITVIVVLAGLALMPLLAWAVDEPYWLRFWSRVMILALAAVGVNLILGFGGMVSFGHAMYIAIGAYAVGALRFHGVEGGLPDLLLAVGAGALVALIIGAICLRTAGIYFIMITLAFAQMTYFFFISQEQYGGDDGMRIEGGTRLGPLDLSNDATLYYATFLLLCGALLVSWRLVNARFGMVIRGARSNEQRMAALGFPTYRYRLIAYVISAVICAIAGALLANLTLYVSPAYTHWTRSGELLIMVILGGLGSLFGPVLGAIALLLLEDVIAHFTRHWQLFLGPILILVVIFARQGLFGLLTPRRKRSHTAGGSHG
ncbi:branched-chain amino acid ABC transporter permease [Aquibaculum sediminis]|uniref:branched-chain amino acid ABC transporter permease n=1 Tax=Aquibaculum sediminis TaxID=3231907 RepID=UPI003456A708